MLEFRENVGQFAQAVIGPHAEEVDKANDFPKSVNLWKEMGDFGLLGRPAWAPGHVSPLSHHAVQQGARSAKTVACGVQASPLLRSMEASTWATGHTA